MTIVEAIISAVIQGVTEFLPISSSGHLVILPKFLGYKTPDFFYQTYLHGASLLAVIAVFRKDILRLFRPEKRPLFYILLGSIPVLLAGFFLKEKIRPFFENANLTGYFLILNGVWLLMGHMRLRNSGPGFQLNSWRSLAIGISQATALFPGISRSGATITCGLLLGMDRIEAYRFSFLLFIPVVTVALIYNLAEPGRALVECGVFPIIIGGLVAFLVSIVALKVLISVLIKSRLYLFAVYCFVVGLLTIIL